VFSPQKINRNFYDYYFWRIMNLDQMMEKWSQTEGREFFRESWALKDELAFDYWWKYYKNQILTLNDELTAANPKAKKIEREGESYLKSQFRRFFEGDKFKLELHNTKQLIKFESADDSELRELVIIATGKCDPVDLSVMKHWLWMVKRKMWDLNVVEHIFVMLYEFKGGSGKTTLIERLTDPLKAYRLQWGFKDISDKANKPTMKKNYIVTMDEMQNASNADMEIIKSLVTASVTDTRKYHTQSNLHSKQNCSFIGSSQKPIAALLPDSGSYRRFYQLDCVNKMDFDAVNALDYISIWNSIDENLEKGYLVGEASAACRERQSKLSTPTITEQFLEEYNIKPVDESDGYFVSTMSLYAHFQKFANARGEPVFKIPNSSNFSRYNMLEKSRDSKGRGTTKISSVSTVFTEAQDRPAVNPYNMLKMVK